MSAVAKVWDGPLSHDLPGLIEAYLESCLARGHSERTVR